MDKAQLTTAVHEAGHAVVLASLGHADEIDYVTVIENFVPPDWTASSEYLKEKLGITLVSSPYENSMAHMRRVLTDGACKPLPLAIECPVALAGVLAQKRLNPDDAFNTRIAGGLGGDIEALVREFNRAGYEASVEDVLRKVHEILFRQPDSGLSLYPSLCERAFASLSDDGTRASAPWDDILRAGYHLANEKLRTHWDAVSELGDCLIEKRVMHSTDLLPLFNRHGL